MKPTKGKLALVPPSVRSPLSKEKQADLALSAAAVKVFEDTLGGRPRITEILATGASDPAVQEVLSLLLDPDYESWPLPKLCAMAGLSVADLFTAFQKAALIRGQIQAASQLEAHLAAIMADLLRRAQPYDEACAACVGTGSVTPDPTRKVPNPSPRPCTACAGTGQIHRLPDLERQKLVFELAELLKKGGGFSISQNMLVATPAAQPTGALEALQQVVSEALYSSPAPSVTDAEVLPPDVEAADAPPLDPPA